MTRGKSILVVTQSTISAFCLAVIIMPGCGGAPVTPSEPAVGVSATSLVFTTMELGASPADQTFRLSNTGVGSFTWTATASANWLSCTPDGGTIQTGETEVTVSVDPAQLLAAGSPYTAQITISAPDAANSPRTVNVTLTLEPMACIELTDSIKSDTTLSAPCYLVESSIGVSDGATLTIQPGVSLRFAQGKHMTVWSDGRLSAVGTASQPIVFTGQEALRGYWGGLRFYQSNSTVNRLDHVTIEYGGGYWEGNLHLAGSSSAPARVAITNCTLRGSEQYGFAFNHAVVEEFAGNTMTENTLGAGSVLADDAGWLDDTSTYTGNDVDVVEVYGSSVSMDRTWPGIDADYLLSGSVDVYALLTINPGARIVFAQGKGMTVWSDGQMAAAGTAEDPIVFTGAEPTRGYWSGLRFYQSNSEENLLDHVTIEYGGGYWEGNLYLAGSSTVPARVNITNCTLRGSERYGFVFNHAVVDEFSGNTVTENMLGAGNVSADDAGWLDDTSTYTGNDADVVEVYGSSVSMDRTWPGIDADYLLSGGVEVYGLLTIDPGARIVFAQGKGMTVWSDGQMSAVGTAEEPVVFTGAEATPGYWGGLRFYHSNSTDNRLDYVTIEYGGGYWRANLLLDSLSSSPTVIEVTNCLIRQSADWGVWVGNYTNVNADLATANTFANNASGDIGTP